MRNSDENTIWQAPEFQHLRLQIESYFNTLDIGPTPNSTQRGSYVGQRVMSQIGEEEFTVYLDELTEAAIFYGTCVKRLPRNKGGQVPDINKKFLLYDVQTATRKLLNEKIGLYQIDPSTECTRTEGFVVELARYISCLMQQSLPKFLHHLLKEARNIQRL